MSDLSIIFSEPLKKSIKESCRFPRHFLVHLQILPHHNL